MESLQNSVQCEWTQVYTLVVERLRAELFDVRTRVENALEMGKVKEMNGKYVANLGHFVSQRQYGQDPQLTVQSSPFIFSMRRRRSM